MKTMNIQARGDVKQQVQKAIECRMEDCTSNRNLCCIKPVKPKVETETNICSEYVTE